jgi:sialidase-1
MKTKIISITILSLLAVCGAAFAAEAAPEGDLKPFLGEPKMERQQVYQSDRFPTVAVARDGSVLAVWNGVKVRRSEDGGATWGPEIPIGPGFMGGGVTVNEANGDIFAFVSEAHPPSTEKIYRSQDHGRTWSVMDAVIKPDSKGNKPEMHMNDHGITLMRGPHKGRMIRPSRFYAKANHHSEWPNHYTNAIYSEDGGKTWLTSEPFPANGTGEATIAELSDGRIYYNTRRHWVPEGEDNSTRWTAMSDDGGVTWKDLVMCKDLPDGPRDTGYGLMGGLVRLPVKDKDILIFSNVESPGGRHHGTVWASFDGGKSWPLKRLVTEGAFAYSSLNAGRPGTKSEGWIYLFSEGAGGEMWRFNLSWLLAGVRTGNGEVPKWIGEIHAADPATEARPAVEAKPATEAKHQAVTPAPRIEKWWFALHAEKVGDMAEKDIDLLMIGDSITHGFDSVGAKFWKEVFEPRKAINLGFGGDRTQHVLWRLENLPKPKKDPKGAVLLIGTNNIGWGSDTPKQAADGIQAIVHKLQQLYPTTRILVLAVFPRRVNPDHPHRKQINEINSLLPDLLKDLKNVSVLDLGPKFLDENGVLSKEIAPDTTHLSEKGFEIWAKAIEPELKKLLGEQ